GYAPEHARAEIGYVLSREHWGKGLMPEAVRAVILFGFLRMGSTAYKPAVSQRTPPRRGSWRRPA
ncbi:MAG TPA: GNAT family N-acetyltransferase, partial [Rubrobacter sp.]|nr:GNAT family N-acetyltransferase [Rubrobacter sp.]